APTAATKRRASGQRPLDRGEAETDPRRPRRAPANDTRDESIDNEIDIDESAAWLRFGRFVSFALTSRRESSPRSGGKSTCATVQICEASSNCSYVQDRSFREREGGIACHREFVRQSVEKEQDRECRVHWTWAHGRRHGREPFEGRP